MEDLCPSIYLFVLVLLTEFLQADWKLLSSYFYRLTAICYLNWCVLVCEFLNKHYLIYNHTLLVGKLGKQVLFMEYYKNIPTTARYNHHCRFCVQLLRDQVLKPIGWASIHTRIFLELSLTGEGVGNFVLPVCLIPRDRLFQLSFHFARKQRSAHTTSY